MDRFRRSSARARYLVAAGAVVVALWLSVNWLDDPLLGLVVYCLGVVAVARVVHDALAE